MADILLKDRDGTPVAKEGVDNGINVLLTDGTEKLYVDSDTVPEPVERTVELDFSESDTMTITPEEGQVFSSIVIPKPESMIPENIAEGVEIARIIGTRAAAGGVQTAYGVVVGDGTKNRVVTHGLGVVPDFVARWPIGYGTYETDDTSIMLGVSSQLAQKLGAQIGILKFAKNEAGFYGLGAWSNGITGFSGIYATAQIVEFKYPEADGINYAWLAVAGLA